MKSGEQKAVENAINLLRRNNWYYPGDTDIKELVLAENLRYLFKPLYNCEGRIIFNYSTAVITINSNIVNKEKINFIFAHELGHFYNERKRGNNKYAEDRYLPYSTNLSGEREANAFAAELLMPRKLLLDIFYGSLIEKELFSRISAFFKVSLTAAVLRHASLAEHPASVIMTKNNHVEWNYVNDHFMFGQVPKGRRKPEIEEDGIFFRRKTKYDLFGTSSYQYESEYKNINARDWYWHDSRCDYFDKLKQIDFVMPRYNSVLSLLWKV